MTGRKRPHHHDKQPVEHVRRLEPRRENSSVGRLPEVFGAFLKLGLISFGGPVAHLSYFREEFVAKRRWLADSAYGDLVALCQFLPGPASSQVAFALGAQRAGWMGGMAASAGFTVPSAVLMILFGYGVAALGDPHRAGWCHGLKLVAVAVVAQAVWVAFGLLQWWQVPPWLVVLLAAAGGPWLLG